MSVLFRVGAALLIAVPAFLVLVIVFALVGRRRTFLPLESDAELGRQAAARASTAQLHRFEGASIASLLSPSVHRQ
jgi:hypothetical protein